MLGKVRASAGLRISSPSTPICNPSCDSRIGVQPAAQSCRHRRAASPDPDLNCKAEPTDAPQPPARVEPRKRCGGIFQSDAGMIGRATSCRNSFGVAVRDPSRPSQRTPPAVRKNPFPSRVSILNSSPGKAPVTILGTIWDWEQRTGKGKHLQASIFGKRSVTNWRLWKNSL
jgi:hypothetical protein